MMGRKRRGSPAPTDLHAGFGAKTAGKPMNLEEAHQKQADDLAREDAPLVTGHCGFCNAPATPDPRGTHECARCRMKAVATA